MHEAMDYENGPRRVAMQNEGIHVGPGCNRVCSVGASGACSSHPFWISHLDLTIPLMQMGVQMHLELDMNQTLSPTSEILSHDIKFLC